MNIDYVYTDLHIHTSDNPDELRSDYDLDLLIDKVLEKANGANCLISLTDHNTINVNAYATLRARELIHFILGVELHISNTGTKPYHCHAYFRESDEQTITELNDILDTLYPKKLVEPPIFKTLPTIEKIITSFDGYDFILVPHGGQSHSAFNTSIEENESCDTAVLRSIYYNQFEGFSSRNPTRTEKTISYFEKLGIDSFVNLVTGSDNYSPALYPQTHSKGDAETFLPTWMKSSPSFEGLRIALSESSRLRYSEAKPSTPPRAIETVSLHNENTDIHVSLTDGLNVVIGGSSCGKTLFADSVARQLGYSEDDSVYERFGVANLKVETAAQRKPHYITQNYILKVADEKLPDFSLDKLEIVKSIFPEDSDFFKETDRDARKLRETTANLITSVEQADNLESSLSRIDTIANLVVREATPDNPLNAWLPPDESYEKMILTQGDYDTYIESIDIVKDRMQQSAFSDDCQEAFQKIEESLGDWKKISKFESQVHALINSAKTNLDSYYKSLKGNSAQRSQEFKKLKDLARQYVKQLRSFDESAATISRWDFHCCSKDVTLKGHHLSVENYFDINENAFLNEFQKMYPQSHILPALKAENIGEFFVKHTRKKDPKITSYDNLRTNLNMSFDELRKRTYSITTKEGRDWKNLSAGWKTATILDLIFASDADTAPLIIDQPEDNLAANYLTNGLIEAIKEAKTNRQIIAITHTAAIPMLADAQNVILCQDINGVITIRSGMLDGTIEGRSTLDWIAEITDGGKKALRKRMKKYAMKDYASREKSKEKSDES